MKIKLNTDHAYNRRRNEIISKLGNLKYYPVYDDVKNLYSNKFYLKYIKGVCNAKFVIRSEEVGAILDDKRVGMYRCRCGKINETMKCADCRCLGRVFKRDIANKTPVCDIVKKGLVSISK